LLKTRAEDLHLDRELPADLPSEDEIEGHKSRRTLVVNLAQRERHTVRQSVGPGRFPVSIVIRVELSD
jgi:hypothetical protein